MIMLLMQVGLVGFVAWAITQIPMREPFKVGIYVLALFLIVIILVRTFGDIPLR